jgi:hypothetical protein
MTLMTSSTVISILGTPRIVFADPLLPMGTDRYLKQIDPSSGTMTIQGVSFTLTETDLPADKNLVVLCYQLTLDGPMTLQGRNILIAAQEIIVNENTSISTSGGQGKSYTNQTAQPAGGLGQDGVNGFNDTGPGQNAGNIAIIAGKFTGSLSLDAYGGNGGDAMSGSDGAPGTPGPDATPTQAAVQGGPGGRGGLAGAPGPGGNGGNILFSIIGGPDARQLAPSPNTSGGSPGKPGHHGQSGPGGHSGVGGSGTYWHMGRCRQGHTFVNCQVNSPWSRPGAPPSIKPPPRSEPIPTAAGGAAGTVSMTSATVAALASHITPSFINMVLAEAIRYYINDDRQGAVSRLSFLNGIVQEKLKAIDAHQPDFQRLQASSTKISSLIRNLALQLDYFGQPLNHVPRLSVQDYIAQTSQLIAFGKDIESTYLDYQSVEKAQQASLAKFIADKTKALGTVNSATTQISELASQQGDTLASIERLDVALVDFWTQLLAADEAFKAAVANLPGAGCQFSQVVTVGACVASLVASGGATAAALPAALAALDNGPLKPPAGTTVTDAFDAFKYKTDTLITVGKDAVSIVDAFNKLKNSFTPPPVAAGHLITLPTDAVKIVATADQIEKELQPYLADDMPEAQKYDSLIKLFVATSETRNNKVLEFNAFDAQIGAAQADIARAQAEADAAQNEMAVLNNPFVGDALNFMNSAWVQSLSSISRAIYQMKAAYKYYTLKDADITIEDFSTGSLTSALQKLTDDYKMALESFGADPEPIDRLAIPLLPYVPSTTLAKFRHSGSLTVSIDVKQPDLATLFNVYVSRVWLKIESSAGVLQSFRARIRHEGRAVLFDAQRKPYSFSHMPVQIEYIIRDGNEIVNGTIIQQQSQYAGLTPYGPWTIEIDMGSIPTGYLINVTNLSLLFMGSGRS